MRSSSGSIRQKRRAWPADQGSARMGQEVHRLFVLSRYPTLLFQFIVLIIICLSSSGKSARKIISTLCLVIAMNSRILGLVEVNMTGNANL